MELPENQRYADSRVGERRKRQRESKACVSFPAACALLERTRRARSRAVLIVPMLLMNAATKRD
jgi:hypothetical protein